MNGAKIFRTAIVLASLIELLWIHAVSAEDYYEVLGISKDATNKEIRKAFKRLALIHHPDKNTVSRPTVANSV